MLRRSITGTLLLGIIALLPGSASGQAVSAADASADASAEASGPSGRDTLRLAPVLGSGGEGEPGSLAQLSDAWVELAPDDLPLGEAFEATRDGRPCIAVETDGEVVAVGRRVPADSSRVVRLTWSWFLGEGIRGSSLRSGDADDYGARVLVNFRFDPDREGPLARMGHALRGDLYGVDAPGSVLSYVWSLEDEPGRTAWNPNTDRVATVVVSHAPDSGWVTLTRDVVRDYETIFGEPPPPITSIVLFSDSDDTGQRTRSCFGEVMLVR